MEWLIILALAGWSWWQTQRIGALTRRIDALERRLAPAPAPVAETAAAPVAEPAEEELLLTEALPPDVLVLDTPLPIASNDAADSAPLVEAREEAAPPPTEELPPRPIPEAARPAPRSDLKPDRRLEQWLAENGLAWLGGGLFALGGILLVAFAAQQSWFTPEVRLMCALVLGVALIGASEWVLRRPDGHELVAALLAGAGVATFYATAWGAHALYGFIDWRTAAGALVLAAVLLVALSFRHGQPLGVIAIIAALFAPAIASYGAWPPWAMTLFVCAVAAAGFALAALQRWAWVAIATLAGLYFWFAGAIAVDEMRRALALLSSASLGGVALAFRPPLIKTEDGVAPWSRTHALAPSIAICVSSVALFWVWLSTAPAPSGVVSGPAWVGSVFVLLAAAAVRHRVAAPQTLAVAIAALAVGFTSYLNARFSFGPLGADFYPFILFASVVVAGSAIFAKPHRRARTLTAAAGAIGAALLTIFAATSRIDWHGAGAWAPLFIGAAILFGAAWTAARDAQDAGASAPVDFWAGAGAALLLLGVESLFPAAIRTAGHASVALTLAAAFTWKGWRALRWGALAAATLTLMHALSTELFGGALSGALPLWRALATMAISAGFLVCGAYIVARRAPRSVVHEALSSAALLMVLFGVFLALRWFAGGAAGAGLDRFTEAALRALALLAAGHVVLPRAGAETGRIAAVRGHLLMGLGFAYALLMCGMAYNPWWGGAPSIIDGPPLLGPLALAFAIPAALLLAAAARLYGRQLLPARLYAGAGGLFVLVWLLLEIRRAFHGADTARGDVGVFEGACYGLTYLGAAFLIALAARMRAVRDVGPFTQDLNAITRGCAWAGLIVGASILLVSRHPWWGGHDALASDGLASGLAVLAQAGAVALMLLLGRALSLDRQVEPTRFAAAAAALVFAWSFGHSAIRWGYHQGAMDDGAPLAGLEGLAHAIWPLAFVLLGSAITVRTPGRDTVRAYLYDLQALWAAMVWPALVFAALGLWLLFNPWWGVAPAFVDRPAAAALAIGLCVFAAALSVMALRVPHVRAALWFVRAITLATVGHLFVAATLTVRASFQDGAIAGGAAAIGVEMWVYSAVWAMFGAGVLAYGVRRDDALLRWCGLAILFATAAKVIAFDTARLSGIIRVVSVLGLAAVVTLTALAMRRIGRPPPPPSPQDVLTVIPSARRGRPHARRRTSP